MVEGTVLVDLSAVSGIARVEWLNPATGQAVTGKAISGGGARTFAAPFRGDAVLYLKAHGQAPEQ
jgi:hypothetical protein